MTRDYSVDGHGPHGCGGAGSGCLLEISADEELRPRFEGGVTQEYVSIFKDEWPNECSTLLCSIGANMQIV